MVDGDEDDKISEDNVVEVVYDENNSHDKVGEQLEDELDTESVDMANTTFSQHTKGVFCIDVSKDEQYVISGGEDDCAYIWNSNKPDEFKKIEGHKDSVTQCGFSQNDKYFFTADMSGYLQMYELEKEVKIWEFEVGDIHWARWHPLVPILLVGADDGTVWMWKVPSFETKTIQLCNIGAVCSTFLSTNRHLAVGYLDGSVRVIDLKEGVATVSVDTHTEITCIAASKDDSLLVVGDTSAQLHVIASGKLIKTLSSPSGGEEGEDSVEDVVFHPSRNLLAASHVGGRVVLWDTALQKTRTVLEHSDGVIKSVWAGEHDRNLVTACLDGVIRVWDVDKVEIVTEVTGHTSSILDITLCSSFVVTSSEDTTVKIFKI